MKKINSTRIQSAAPERSLIITASHQRKVSLVKTGLYPGNEDIESILRHHPRLSSRGYEAHPCQDSHPYRKELYNRVHEVRDCLMWLSKCKFDPDGRVDFNRLSSKSFARLIRKERRLYNPDSIYSVINADPRHKKVSTGALIAALIYLEVPWDSPWGGIKAPVLHDEIWFAYAKDCPFINSALSAHVFRKGVVHG